MRDEDTSADVGTGAGPGGEPDDDTRSEDSTPAGRPGLLLAAGAVVLVAGLALLAVFGWRYLQARDDQRVATERDRALGVASQVLVNAYSFDQASVDDGLRHLRDASTGDFLEQQKQWAADVRTRVIEQKAVTRASVSHAATQAFDADAGTATVLLVFTAESRRENQPSITGRQAARVELLRVDDVWKVSGLTPVGVVVPVGDSSASVAALGGGGTTPAPGVPPSTPPSATQPSATPPSTPPSATPPSATQSSTPPSSTTSPAATSGR